ncbi:MAG: hypothetical protein EBT80_07080 [Chitinophagales bacterium]|nr:hypothetical protein [Chitinophagales bacterium]
MTDRIFESVLSTRHSAWENGETPIPSRASVYKNLDDRGFTTFHQKALKISIVFPRYWPHNGMESDLWIHFPASASRAGHYVSQFDVGSAFHTKMSDLSPHRFSKPRVGSQALQDFLCSERPDIVIFDGNLLPHSGNKFRDELNSVKSEVGFKLCAVIGDLHDFQPRSRLTYWGDISDLLVIYNSENRHYMNFAEKEKVLVAPFPPFDEGRFRTRTERTIGLGFCGGKGRRRDAFLSFARECGIPTDAHFVDDKGYLNEADFYDFMSRSKITFSNGHVGTIDGLPRSVLTGRIAESILSGSVLVYESGSQIDDYLVPFVHYIPVDNVHELVHACRYLLKNDAQRVEMANKALSFVDTHYSSKDFWNCVTRQLCNVESPQIRTLNA